MYVSHFVKQHRKLLRFEITKMLIAVLKIHNTVSLIIIFGTLSFPIYRPVPNINAKYLHMRTQHAYLSAIFQVNVVFFAPTIKSADCKIHVCLLEVSPVADH